MYSYIVCSVNAVYICLNMFSPNVHIMQCNVQLHCLFCQCCVHLSQHVQSKCTHYAMQYTVTFSALSMLSTFVSTCSFQQYTLCNVIYSYFFCSVSIAYIRLNMCSPTVHIMQCNVQLLFLFCQCCVHSSDHVHSNNTHYAMWCTVTLFSLHTPFTLLLHQTVWQPWTQEALAAAVSVQFNCIATLNCVCLCAIFHYLPVPHFVTFCAVWMQQTVWRYNNSRHSSFLNY